MREKEEETMPSEEEESDIMSLVKELQASLKRNDSLEKENQELQREVARLKAQVISLKAHDNERKSILWKKLQSSVDSSNTDAANQKSSKLDEKANEAEDSSPRQNFQHSTIRKENAAQPLKPPTNTLPTATKEYDSKIKAPTTPVPPPPPPLLSNSSLGLKSVRRMPEVVELYRALTRKESQKGSKMKHTTSGPAFSRSMIGEIENRSRYLSAIKSDVERQKDHINFLIGKVESAAFSDISDVETFVKWLDEELASLVDERAVLKHFPQWPERKADALREAAIHYQGMRDLESEASSFKDNPQEPLTQAFQRIQSLQDRLEESVSNGERMRESSSKRYKDFQIPMDWMLDTGLISKMKYSSLRLGREYMIRAYKELQSNCCSREGNLLLQAVRFAYRVHQFAGGFDGETINAFHELKKIISDLKQ